MAEGITTDNLLNNIMETLADSVSKHKPVSFFEEEKPNVSYQLNRLFGRQKPVHGVLGGGKSADVLLWRNKKISAGVLTGATITWVLFEWLNYHFMTLVCFALVFGMLAQFVWTNASGMMNRSPSKVPRLVVPVELCRSLGNRIGIEVNRFLGFLQDVASRGDLKQFLMVVLSLFAVAVIGSWVNFLTVIYIGFIAAHTLPVIYEKYDDQIDKFIYDLLGQLQHHSGKVNASFLSRIPTRNFQRNKSD